MNRLLCLVLDGVGESPKKFGNAVLNANTPHLHALRQLPTFTTLAAHGHAVGLPETKDIGNSEVGHNAMGAGNIYDQGAKLVANSIASGKIFQGEVWKKISQRVQDHSATLHFLGLLSDGNVHSHHHHLHAMLQQARKDNIKKVRIHVLLDGRDVPEGSAEKYVEELETLLSELSTGDFDYKIASGGGRMHITICLLYTSPSPRDRTRSRMPSSA